MPTTQAVKACLQSLLDTAPSTTDAPPSDADTLDSDLTHITTLLATALGTTVARSPRHRTTLVSSLAQSLDSLALRDTIQALGPRVYAVMTYNEDVTLSDYSDDEEEEATTRGGISALRARLAITDAEWSVFSGVVARLPGLRSRQQKELMVRMRLALADMWRLVPTEEALPDAGGRGAVATGLLCRFLCRPVREEGARRQWRNLDLTVRDLRLAITAARETATRRVTRRVARDELARQMQQQRVVVEDEEEEEGEEDGEDEAEEEDEGEEQDSESESED
ncbi:hypothetical protein DFH27DRAFT_615945 [Peziza echinospora]|nr:hypothetical protein DFH27DRAFT_615945 [Peziza echinospora]